MDMMKQKKIQCVIVLEKSKKYRKFYIFSCSFNIFFKFAEHSTRGRRGFPKLKPDKLRASLIGIGLVSANNE